MNKYVETVRGPMLIEDIGITLTHEHLSFSCVNFITRLMGDDRQMTDEKITPENRDKVTGSHYNGLCVYKDNIVYDDVDDIVKELEDFKAAGGSTIFDVTPSDLGRDPLKLKEISEKSGVNVIMGSGYYGIVSMDPVSLDLLLKKGLHEGVHALADHMIREFYDGVGDTGIKPGVLGEIGQHRGETEGLLARAALIAQKETGAPLIFHGPWLSVLDVAKREGADLSKIVMGHWNMDWPVEEAMKRGAWVSIDQFGINYPELTQDERRIEDVLKFFDRGWDKQLLISQDMCDKTRLKKNGGAGYGELFTSTFPKLIARGLTQEQLDRVMIDNPKRLLQ